MPAQPVRTDRAAAWIAALTAATITGTVAPLFLDGWLWLLPTSIALFVIVVLLTRPRGRYVQGGWSTSGTGVTAAGALVLFFVATGILAAYVEWSTVALSATLGFLWAAATKLVWPLLPANNSVGDAARKVGFLLCGAAALAAGLHAGSAWVALLGVASLLRGYLFLREGVWNRIGLVVHFIEAALMLSALFALTGGSFLSFRRVDESISPLEDAIAGTLRAIGDDLPLTLLVATATIWWSCRGWRNARILIRLPLVLLWLALFAIGAFAWSAETGTNVALALYAAAISVMLLETSLTLPDDISRYRRPARFASLSLACLSAVMFLRGSSEALEVAQFDAGPYFRVAIAGAASVAAGLLLPKSLPAGFRRASARVLTWLRPRDNSGP